MAGWYFLEHAWAAGRAVHLVPRAELDELLGAVERWRASTLYCIPAVWQRILDHGAGYDASSLREVLTGTSRVDLDLVDALKARFPGSWTSVAYGSTEIGRGAVLADRDLYSKPGSVGLPPPAVESVIAADGELLQRGPTMFSGYLDRPDATAAAIDDDGWYHTGDLATQDDDGYLTITGRRSEGIRSGGEWIAPVEVEAAILTHPAVSDVGVVGLPHDRWGEVVCAAIVVRPGANAPSVDELRAHVASRLAAHKHPRVVVTMDRLPRTDATGQVRRAALRDDVASARRPEGGPAER
jgi:acyl-CoA synthetase (AMP-forming)/AMP-acid ligase II